MNIGIKDKFTDLLEPFETMGQWWIPGSSDKFNGLLNFCPQESLLELKILGNILPLKNGPLEVQKIKILHGLTLGGQYMTLLNSLYMIDIIRVPGYISCKIIPQYIFVGCWFDNESEILFNEAMYSCHNIEQFLGESGLNTEIMTDNGVLSSYTLTYKYPERLCFKIGSYAITTSWRVNLPIKGPDIHISERAGFEISSPNPKTHSDFLKEPITTIHNFLELIIDERLPIRNIILRSDNIGDKDNEGIFRKEPIFLIFPQLFSFPLPKMHHPIEMIFTIRGLKDDLNTIFQKWHDSRLKFKSAYNLFFTVLRMRKELTDQNTFLNLCHVLEAYHRIKCNETYTDHNAYQELLQSIVDHVPDEHKEYIQQRLRYGNELSLRQRIKRIYDLLPGTIQNQLGNQSNFSKNIVDTRNFLTHYDEKSKDKAMPTREIMQCNNKLYVIAKALFLMEAGFRPDFVGQKLGGFHEHSIVSFDSSSDEKC